MERRNEKRKEEKIKLKKGMKHGRKKGKMEEKREGEILEQSRNFSLSPYDKQILYKQQTLKIGLFYGFPL